MQIKTDESLNILEFKASNTFKNIKICSSTADNQKQNIKDSKLKS